MKRIIIIGAGEGGRRLIREIVGLKKSIHILGLLDDDPNKIDSMILGVKVIGNIKYLDKLASVHIEEVIIAIPSLRGRRLAQIVESINRNRLRFRIMPGIFESLDYLTTQKVPMGLMRRVELADLLDRGQIEIDVNQSAKYLKNKTVLVTGAGGSIGSELARQILFFKPKKIILIDNYENKLFELQNECEERSTEFIVADIKDKNMMEKIFQKFHPEIVFHAAAHKHVPLMEKAPVEAIKNNILGSVNVIDVACNNNAEKFILISTDKAISPTSIMGATKRFVEEYIFTLQDTKTNFAIVRFGNVLGSHGSVIPLWQKQLSNRDPLTITDRRMKRFFMTIPEAVQLVIQAGAMVSKTEIFILKMGKQYKIVDLAKDFLKLNGQLPNYNIKIIGIRPGEKLSEVLNERNEHVSASSHKNIVKVKTKFHTTFNIIGNILKEFQTEIDDMSRDEIINLLKKVVPTYKLQKNK